MPRLIPAVIRREIEAQESGLFLLALVEITHPDLLAPIRVANDIVDYLLSGNRYVGMPFELDHITDGDRPPSGRLRVQNVDQRIGEWVLSLSSPPRLRIDIYSGDDFGALDESKTRTAIGTPSPFYSARHLRLRNVSVDAVAVSGEIGSWDPGREPWPSIRATKDRLPGLFR